MRIKKIISILFFIFGQFTGYTQTANWEWAFSPSSAQYNQMSNIVCGPDGSFYVSGLCYDSIALNDTTLYNINGEKNFIAKFDENHQIIWARLLESSSAFIHDLKIAIDHLGYMYICGNFANTDLVLDSIAIPLSDAEYDVVIAKLNPEGNVLWAKIAGGTENDYANGITSDEFGNVYITGDFKSPTITFGNITLNNHISYYGDYYDIFIAKYDSSGNIKWCKNSGGPRFDKGYSIITDHDNNVIITGTFVSNSINFDNYTLYNNGGSDLFVAKYNPAGNVIWTRNFGGCLSDEGQYIAVDINDNIIISGNYDSPEINFDTVSIDNTNTNNNIFVVKIEPSGNAVWARNSTGTEYDYNRGLAVDANDNVLVIGDFSSPSINFDGLELINHSEESTNIFAVKYNAYGQILMAEKPIGTLLECCTGISCDHEGKAYMTGRFSGSLSFGANTLINPESPADGFISKFNSPQSGFEEYHNDQTLRVFPNPTQGDFFVTPPQDVESIQIINTWGQVIESVFCRGKKNYQFHLEKSGVYLIRAISGNTILSGRVIVSKMQ